MASINDTTTEEEKCWLHPFHHKLLTLQFVGYLITDKDWRTEILKLNKEKDLEILTGPQGEGKFEEFVGTFNKLLDVKSLTESIESTKPTNGFVRFVDSANPEKNTKDEPIYQEKCRREVETEYSRYRQLCDKKDKERDKKDAETDKKVADTDKKDAETDNKDAENKKKDTEMKMKDTEMKLKDKYAPGIDAWLKGPPEDPDAPPLAELIEKETHKRVKDASNEFKIVFGRRDHHLVASLVEALWDMKKEGEIRMAYVPREQLLSVDMEDRVIREVTLQLHPNKPVYKRRDKDEIRGFEEAFVGVTPWCRVPGGRYLPRVINDAMYNKICGREEMEEVKKIWIEDEWLMNERKRIYRAERKLNKDKTPVKVTDPYDQVNHYLPILKEVSGFRGLIRDEEFYEGLQGLIYIIRVVKMEKPADLLTHVERLTSKELQFRRDLRELKLEREAENKS